MCLVAIPPMDFKSITEMIRRIKITLIKSNKVREL